MTASCNRDTFSMGCRSSVDSLSGFALGGGGGGVEESLTDEMFSLGDSAPLDLFPVSTPSLVCGELRGLLLGERAGLLAPGRLLGLRPRPRPDDGLRTRLSFSPSPSGFGPNGLQYTGPAV